MVRLTKSNKNVTNAKKRGILRLLSAPARYIKYKVVSIYKKLVKKEQKKTDNEEKLKRKSIDDAYDGKIRDKISDVRMILSRLGNTTTKKDKKKIQKELYEIENKKNLSDKGKKKRFMIILLS